MGHKKGPQLMQAYDFYEGKDRTSLDEPLRAKSVTHVLGIKCYLCVRNGPLRNGSGRQGLEKLKSWKSVRAWLTSTGG